MSFLGLVPRECSSGDRRRQGAITKAGNGHVRRMLVESAWSYRFPARKTKHLRQKAAAAPEAVQALAWAAQKRLCARYRDLYQVGKNKCYVTTAVARELVRFCLGHRTRGQQPATCVPGRGLSWRIDSDCNGI